LRKITATLPALVMCLILVSCETGKKSIILQFNYSPGVSLLYDQTSKEAYEVTENSRVTKKNSTTMSATVEQSCRRVMPDSTAEILESDKWVYTAPNEKDSTVLDTIRESRDMVVYMKPNGKVVDLEFKSKIDSATANYIEQYYAQAMPVFPAGEVTQGSKWTQSTRVMVDSTPTDAVTSYELASFAREQGYDCAVVNYSGNLIIPIKANPEDTTKRTGINRIQSTGTLYVAYKEGMVVLQKETWVVDGDRRRLRDGKWVESKVRMNMETLFSLKERKQI
jgi:hypothetical protein